MSLIFDLKPYTQRTARLLSSCCLAAALVSAPSLAAAMSDTAERTTATATATATATTATTTATASDSNADSEAALRDVRSRSAAGEIIYFLLPDRFENGDPSNDRGHIKGGRNEHGYDPTHKGFFHGGDLVGLRKQLDYIQGLGATAIWLAPIFHNKPVQGDDNIGRSAGYHGYWVTDFTRVDSHFGDNDDFRALVAEAHARGLKVYMDIITNHTADVINYKEGEANDYRYRSLADYPYSTRGAADGEHINKGFVGGGDQSEENFAKLTDPNYAYTPYVPEAEKNIKKPAWLNNVIYYHNRGSSTFSNEDSLYGDFSGLDDLFTENPRVVRGMIDIYASWIDRFGVDGFRIDTARHVNPEFWQAFVPAIEATAAARGIPNFHIFGEVYSESPNNGYLARYTRRDGFPAVLDFAFQSAVREVLGRGAPTTVLADMFAGDVLYRGGDQAALAMPTFLGNHDMGRFAYLIRSDRPDIDAQELLQRVELGHIMLLTLRGSPTIYYGDEQGFVGDGRDQDAREDMFASQTASYNDNDLLGSTDTTAARNFNRDHRLYKLIAELAKLRAAHPALQRGHQRTRHFDNTSGIFAVSRFDPTDDREYVVVYNTTLTAKSQAILVETRSQRFESLYGECSAQVTAPGSLMISLPPLSAVICRAQDSK